MIVRLLCLLAKQHFSQKYTFERGSCVFRSGSWGAEVMPRTLQFMAKHKPPALKTDDEDDGSTKRTAEAVTEAQIEEELELVQLSITSILFWVIGCNRPISTRVVLCLCMLHTG